MDCHSDNLDPSRRFILGATKSSRLEIDFFNLYTWILQFVEGKRVLDIACGSGLGSFLLAHRAAMVDAVDVSAEAVRFAGEHYRLPNLEFRTADAFHASLPEAYYDVIVCSMTLEQLDPARHGEFLRILAGSLKADGMLILVTPNKHVTAPYSARGGGHHWNKHEYIKSELTEALLQAGYDSPAWYGRRRVFSLFTLIPIRKCISALQRLFKKDFGFFGRRERAEVLPVNLFWQAKDFVVVSKKTKLLDLAP